MSSTTEFAGLPLYDPNGADSTVNGLDYFNALTNANGSAMTIIDEHLERLSIQCSTLPQVTAADNGKIVQYVGADNASVTPALITGHWYQVVSGAWQEIVYGDPNSVSYSAQTGRSDADKEQARNNIAAQQETSALTEEETLDDGDYIPVYDTSASKNRKTLWSNIKSKLKSYFDGLYVPDTRTINEKSLDANIVLDAEDVGAATDTHTHGNIANNGSIGTEPNLPIFTGVDGALCAIDPYVARHYLGAASNPNLLDNWFFGGAQIAAPVGAKYFATQPTPSTDDSTAAGTVEDSPIPATLLNVNAASIAIGSTTYYVKASACVQTGGFPINQRGLAACSIFNSYSIDRWFAQGYGALTIMEGKFRLETLQPDQYFNLIQTIESKHLIPGATYTLSWKVASKNGGFHLRVLQSDAAIGHGGNFIDQRANSTDQSFTFVWAGNLKYLQITICHDTTVVAGDYVEIEAIKLELGDKQTLAREENGVWVLNDPPPDYGQELAKCQRYLFPLHQFGAYLGYADDADRVYFTVNHHLRYEGGNPSLINPSGAGFTIYGNGTHIDSHELNVNISRENCTRLQLTDLTDEVVKYETLVVEKDGNPVFLSKEL